MTRSKHFVVSGKVQGVFFRSWTHDQAVSLGLSGWVRNLADGQVEILAQGHEDKIQELKTRLIQGSPMSRVENVESEWMDYEKSYEGFDIR